MYILGTDSKNESVTCGVLQGSILSPLLFIIYVNDISKFQIEYFLFYLPMIQ